MYGGLAHTGLGSAVLTLAGLASMGAGALLRKLGRR